MLIGSALVAGALHIYNEGSKADSTSDGKSNAGNADTGSRETGSYTNTHESGKKYHGKGDRTRSQQSGKEKEEQYGDRHIATDWTRASDDKQAFKDEAARIKGDGGVANGDNFNKINSPGKKYLE